MAYRFKKNMIKPISVIVAVLFVATTALTSNYEKKYLSVDVIISKENAIMLLNIDGSNLLVGNVNESVIYSVEDALSSHNGKKLDGIYVVENSEKAPSGLLCLYNSFGKTKTYFRETPQVIDENYGGTFNRLIFSGDIYVNSIGECGVEIIQGENALLVLNSDKFENLLENHKEYDIIILYGSKSKEIEREIAQFLENDDSMLYVLTESESATVYFK